MGGRFTASRKARRVPCGSCTTIPLSGPKRREDRFGIPRPGRGPGGELTAPGSGERVVLGATIGFRHAPLAGHPFLLLQSMQGVVERALLDLERAAGGVVDPSRDGVAVPGPPRERLEHEHVERAFEKVEVVVAHGAWRTVAGCPECFRGMIGVV